MSFFEKARDEPYTLEAEYLGEPYNYSSKIKTPEELNITSDNTQTARTTNLNGLIGYSDILTKGGGIASKIDGPLGNKFFMYTGTTCKDVDTDQNVPRHLYFNNIPDSEINNGLLDGTEKMVNNLNPYKLMESFSQGTEPECQEITLEVVDSNNNKTNETHYLTLSDINALEGFQGKNTKIVKKSKKCTNLPSDPTVQIYYGLLGAFGVYIMYNLMKKT